MKQEDHIDDAIDTIDIIYNEKFKFIYYHWVAKQIVTLEVVTNVRRVGSCKFHQVEMNCNLKFTPTICTTIEENFVWENFNKIF